jgi:GR25 family glycosyltransferase involved in LPS biosynthesis
VKQNTQIAAFAKRAKCFVINLEKNVKRLNLFLDRYNRSDLSAIELERFNAINGKKIDISNFVTDKALKQIEDAEKNGYRLRHYELTRGAVGCFLSHTTLFKRLLTDPNKDFYIIFEDDANVPPNVVKKIKFYVDNAPNNWDIIVFGVLREEISGESALYDKVRAWWGLFGYAVSKRGAQRFVDYLQNHGKIDKQIDSMMSLMTTQNQFNVYSTRVHLIDHNAEANETDIQLPVQVQENIDPFKYENIVL